MRRLVALIALLPLTAAPAQVAPSSARSVVEKAVAAHGGKEKLARARAEKVFSEGTLVAGSETCAFVSETAVQLPGRYRSAVTLARGKERTTLVQVLDGDKGATYLDGKEQAGGAMQAEKLRRTLSLERALRLVPLLDDAAVALERLDDVRYNDRVLCGVRVVGGGHRDLSLWFDKAEGLLVRAEYTADGAAGTAVRQESLYGGYRELGGYLRPTRVIVSRGGKKVMDATVTRVEPLGRVEPSFTKP